MKRLGKTRREGGKMRASKETGVRVERERGKDERSKEIGVRMERERGKDESKQRDWSSNGERERER